MNIPPIFFPSSAVLHEVLYSTLLYFFWVSFDFSYEVCFFTISVSDKLAILVFTSRGYFFNSLFFWDFCLYPLIVGAI